MSGTQADTLMLGLVMLTMTGLALLVLHKLPRTAILLWLIVTAFIPVWVGLNIRAYFPAISLISIAAAFSLLPHGRRLQWSGMDLALLAVLIAVAVEALLNLTTVSAGFDMFSSWASAFLLGRLIVQAVEPAWIYGAFAVIFSIVAVLAVIEYSTSINPFIDLLRLDNSLYEIWGTLQPRGGLLRAEGAFGHSIALGASLAMVIVLTLASSLPTWLRFAMAGLMSVAIVLTFSRIGMITAALGIVLFCIFDHRHLRHRYRVLLLVIAGLASAAALTFITDVFLSAGNEAQGSAQYRSQLLALTADLAPLGLAPDFNISTTREVSVGSFSSIDNAALLFGILYGWLPAIVPLAGLLAAVLLVLRRRATPPTIALVAQIPAFFAVALVTQYAAIVWLFAGLSVGTQAIARESASTMGRLPVAAVPTFLALPKLRAMTKGMNYEV